MVPHRQSSNTTYFQSKGILDTFIVQTGMEGEAALRRALAAAPLVAGGGGGGGARSREAVALRWRRAAFASLHASRQAAAVAEAAALALNDEPEDDGEGALLLPAGASPFRRGGGRSGSSSYHTAGAPTSAGRSRRAPRESRFSCVSDAQTAVAGGAAAQHREGTSSANGSGGTAMSSTGTAKLSSLAKCAAPRRCQFYPSFCSTHFSSSPGQFRNHIAQMALVQWIPHILFHTWLASSRRSRAAPAGSGLALRLLARLPPLGLACFAAFGAFVALFVARDALPARQRTYMEPLWPRAIVSVQGAMQLLLLLLNAAARGAAPSRDTHAPSSHTPCLNRLRSQEFVFQPEAHGAPRDMAPSALVKHAFYASTLPSAFDLHLPLWLY